MKKSILGLLITLFISQTTIAEDSVYFGSTITSSSLKSLEKSMVRSIRRMDRNEPRVLTLILSSDGGEIYPAIRFVDKVASLERQHNVQINTQVQGSCDSACTILFTAGRERIASRYSRFGFHSPQVEGRLPRGRNRQEVIASAKAAWVRSIARVDSHLAYELERGSDLDRENFRTYNGRQLYSSGYVTRLE